MTHATGGLGRASSLARNQYQEGQILRARDLERESDYFLARDRQHNALAHGPGILVGLQLIAYKAGTETPVTQEQLFNAPPQALDLAVTAGAAIDYVGRLVIVPKRVPVRLDLARQPSVLEAGTYRLELLYRHAEVVKGPRGSECDQPGTRGVLEEGYQLRLLGFDPDDEMPQLDIGSVLDGPIDDPAVLAPITLGLVQWSGSAYNGYSTGLRPLAPVTAQRMHAPDDQAELELRDGNDRFAVRFADIPVPGSDPFTPGTMQDRFRVDSDGDVWIPAEVSVGRKGVRFRREGDPNNPENSNWRALTITSATGADMGLDSKGDALVPGVYAEGSRELRVLFQREGGNTGKHRVVIGHVDENDLDFQPAMVVYDRSPQAGGTGTATVEIWGDLYVRGTAWLNAAARRPPQPGAGLDELDVLLRQLAGPLAGAFRVFLTSDPAWLQEFAGVMAAKVAVAGAVRTAFVSALVADPGFVAAVTNQAAGQAIPQVVAAVNSAANMPALLAAIATHLDDPAQSGIALPPDTGAAVLAALYRRLLHNALKNQIINSVPPAEQGNVTTALSWLP